MIFVILGTQKFQFNRLLQMLDELVEKRVITDEVCAQIGYSTYLPKHYEYQQFYSEEEFQKKITESAYVISHGGLGSMMSTVRLSKRLIVVPRSSAYGEHIDNHQYQLATLFENKGHALMVENIEQLAEACREIDNFSPVPYKAAPNEIVPSIRSYIEKEEIALKEKVLMVGSDLSVKGGIVSVLKNYLYSESWEFADIIFVPTHIESSKKEKIKIFLSALKSIKKMIRYQNIRIVHIHVSERGSFIRKAIVLKLAKRRNCKVILHHHGAEFEQYYSESGAKQKKFISEILKEADLNIVLSKRLVPMIKKISPEAKVEVLYNSVKLSESTPYNPNARELLMLGRLEQRKGTFGLLETIQAIDKKLPEDIVFHLCGDGNLEAVYEAINRLGIQHRIGHIGWVGTKQKELLFENAMGHILFSNNEGLPMAILETMSQGIVNISTNIASIPEVIFHGETGLLVEAGDKEALGKAILELVTNDHARMEMSQKSYQLICEQFSLEKNIKVLESYYQMLLERD